MARDRSRARRPRSDREGEPVEDTPQEEEPDSGEAERRDRSAGTVEDLANGGRDRVRSETASGSQAALAIDPAINPGFVDTEVVNRMALVLNLNLVWDPDRRHWTPVTTKDLASSAFAANNVRDTTTESLGDVLGATDGIRDNDGSLSLSTGTEEIPGLSDYRRNDQATTSGQSGLVVVASEDLDRLVIDYADFDNPPNRERIYNNTTGTTLVDRSFVGGRQIYDIEIQAGDELIVGTFTQSDMGDTIQFSGVQFPIDLPIGQITSGYRSRDSRSNYFNNIRAIGAEDATDLGTASTSFATPPRATRYSRALYNAELNGGSLRVDLYSGDPSSPTSELLARDIGPREDISDIPPSKGPLQLKFTMRRGSQGNSPRVSKAGIQYEQ